jgi:hypothetical protein
METAMGTLPRRRSLCGEGAVLDVRMMPMMVVVAVMMFRGSERRAGKHHQEQNGGKNLFHAKNVPRTLL